MLILPDNLRRSRLITDAYCDQQAELHKNPDYGVASTHFAPIVSRICNDYNVQELLDYGAGKGRLARSLDVDHNLMVQQYDPAISEFSADPTPSEMVACIDVLEHIEPQLLDNVLDDLQRLTRSVGLFTVCTEEAIKMLPDGRNAHLIIQPAAWWLPKLMERWDLHTFQRREDGFMVLVRPYNLDT
jgi:2-polyprenyl-3-methyl-5-hydroxy-6-metoxy-1,4-benzoquinol methylase